MIKVEGVSKRFGEFTALNDITMEVPPGQVFGLLGPNGAGKTTLIRIITRITGPDEGRVLMDGRPMTPEDVALMGYLPEERGLYRKESVLDVMTYFGQLKGLSREASVGWSTAFLERVD